MIIGPGYGRLRPIMGESEVNAPVRVHRKSRVVALPNAGRAGGIRAGVHLFDSPTVTVVGRSDNRLEPVAIPVGHVDRSVFRRNFDVAVETATCGDGVKRHLISVDKAAVIAS